MGSLRVRDVVTLGLVLSAAIAGTAVALGGRGADSAFLYRQEHPLRLRTSEVERVMRTAPEPVPGRKPRGIAAACRARGSGALRNPWSCTVSYRSGRRVRLRVEVRSDGSYVGRYPGGGATVEGCCIGVPGAE